jgi:histidine triad (HIT) family protein
VKIRFDVGAYVARCRSGPCFVCALVAAEPGAEHHLVHEVVSCPAAHLHWRVGPGAAGCALRAAAIPRPDERNGVLGVDHAAQQALEAPIRKRVKSA